MVFDILGVATALAIGPASYADDPALHQQRLDRPFELGVSGGSIEHIIDGAFAYCYTGTLGALATDGLNDYILSNNHVLAKENDPDNGLAPDGYNIIQPGLLDEGSCTLSLGDPGNIVAYLTDYVEILFGRGKNPPENWIDAAIAQTNTGLTDVVRSDASIRDVGVLTGDPVDAVVGQEVQKSGRTTGHTFGEVVATGVRVKVRYENGTALFVDQIEVVGLCDTNFSDSGDSGSLVATLPDGSGPRAAVGLLFAGGGTSTFANPIQTVLADLGAQAGLNLSMVHDSSGIANDVAGNTAVPSCAVGGDTLAAADDSYKLPKKQTVLSVAAPGVLDNDTGFVGSPVVDTDPSHGNVVLSGDGGFTYSYTGSDRNGDGSDSFVYDITDGVNSATATVTISLASRGGGRPSGAGAGSSGLERALQVRADHEDELFDIPGVLGTGIGADASGRPVIRVYVASAAQSVDHPMPANIEGLPVRVVVTGTIEAY
jgi:hypothetical protein